MKTSQEIAEEVVAAWTGDRIEDIATAAIEADRAQRHSGFDLDAMTKAYALTDIEDLIATAKAMREQTGPAKNGSILTLWFETADALEALQAKITALEDQRQLLIEAHQKQKRFADQNFDSWQAAEAKITAALNHDPLHGASDGLHCGGMAPCSDIPAKEVSLPLDPHPWTDGLSRYLTENSYWTARPRSFAPREGYSQNRKDYS